MVFATNNYFLHADVPFWEFALAEYPATCQPMRKTVLCQGQFWVHFVCFWAADVTFACSGRKRGVHTKARATTFAATTALSFKGATGFV